MANALLAGFRDAQDRRQVEQERNFLNQQMAREGAGFDALAAQDPTLGSSATANVAMQQQQQQRLQEQQQFTMDAARQQQQREASLRAMALLEKAVTDGGDVNAVIQQIAPIAPALGTSVEELQQFAQMGAQNPAVFGQVRQALLAGTADGSNRPLGQGDLIQTEDGSYARQIIRPDGTAQIVPVQGTPVATDQAQQRIAQADARLDPSVQGGIAQATGFGRTVGTAEGEQIASGMEGTSDFRAQQEFGTRHAAAQRELEAPEQARADVTTMLRGMVQDYLALDDMGAVVNPDRGAVANVTSRVRSSGAGQLAEGALGTEAQSVRRRITNLQPLLIQGIRQATGMSARGMDSNRELEFYLQAATDPRSGDIYSNLVAIEVLDSAFGMGGLLDDVLPGDVLQRVRTQARQELEERPIRITEDQLLQSVRQERRGPPQGIDPADWEFMSPEERALFQ